MHIIASSTDPVVAQMLDGFDSPAILVSKEYEILATNDLYRDAFGIPESKAGLPRCYAVSHGYDRPCDQAGETCPLAAASASGERERVLHIHQTPAGREHVDVEMLPVKGADGELRFFIELLRPLMSTDQKGSGEQVKGQSRTYTDMLAMISRVARSDVAVLLTGESGAGKELAANTLHHSSKRSSARMVTLECAGLTETLFESELFGHVRGAFTGANYHKAGLIEAAKGGTLFLDEIGDVPLALQVKLLRLLETGTYRQVGSTDVRHADFRLISATHKDLAAMVEEGAFREDLYYRINVFPVRVPALRERREDISLLARYFLRDIGQDQGLHFTESAIARLRIHPYPGNIRELRNLVARCVILASSNVIDDSVVQRALAGAGQPLSQDQEGARSRLSLKDIERQHLEFLMSHFGNDKTAAARAAGISLRSLYRKLAAE